MERISVLKKEWFDAELSNLKKQGISRAEIARKMGILPQTLNNVINGTRGISDDFLDKFIATFNISQLELVKRNDGIQPITPIDHRFILRTDHKLESQDIPLYDLNATAGLMAIFNDNHISPDDYLRIPNLPPVDGAIYVRGESMTPLLKSGDIIIFKRLALSLDSILWGQIYLLSFIAGGDFFTVVKYVQKSDTPDCIRLVSHNDRFQPKDIPLSSIQALAIVKASITFHTME